MVVPSASALRRWPTENLAQACLAVRAGTAPGGGGANTIPLPILIVLASISRTWLTLVQIATAAAARTASPSAPVLINGPGSRMCFPSPRPDSSLHVQSQTVTVTAIHERTLEADGSFRTYSAQVAARAGAPDERHLRVGPGTRATAGHADAVGACRSRGGAACEGTASRRIGYSEGA